MKGNMLTLPPTWIDNDFLKKALVEGETRVEVVSSTTEYVTEFNDNSCNRVYRVNLEILRNGQKEQTSVVVKASNDEKCKLNSAKKSFVREMEAYSTILPQMTRLLESSRHKFSPKCHYIHRGPPVSAVVLEDLDTQGFRHAASSSSLDMKHCIVVVRKIAQSHASSAVLCAKNPNIKNSLKTSVYSEDSESFVAKILPPLLKKIAEEVTTWPHYKDIFAENLFKLADVAMERLNEAVRTNESDFVVFSHEDLSLNNIMFKYSTDGAEVLDARFLDFQSGHWGTPGIDFYRFLHSCADPEVLEWSQILVEEYYFILEESLSSLGYQHLCPTIAYIYKNFQKTILFGLILGIVDRAILLDAASNDNVDQDSIEDQYNGIELSEEFKRMFETLLQAFHQKGWLLTAP